MTTKNREKQTVFPQTLAMRAQRRYFSWFFFAEILWWFFWNSLKLSAFFSFSDVFYDWKKGILTELTSFFSVISTKFGRWSTNDRKKPAVHLIKLNASEQQSIRRSTQTKLTFQRYPGRYPWSVRRISSWLCSWCSCIAAISFAEQLACSCERSPRWTESKQATAVWSTGSNNKIFGLWVISKRHAPRCCGGVSSCLQ